jgi:hypothetical protein
MSTICIEYSTFFSIFFLYIPLSVLIFILSQTYGILLASNTTTLRIRFNRRTSQVDGRLDTLAPLLYTYIIFYYKCIMYMFENLNFERENFNLIIHIIYNNIYRKYNIICVCEFFYLKTNNFFQFH